MISLIKRFFTDGHLRSLQLKKNILGSLLLQVVGKLIGFVLFPLYLVYVDQERLGVWITISSVIGWFNFFDLGLGNGLKNKFAISKANNDDGLVRTYVSTTYFFVSLLSLGLFLFFIAIYPFVNWSKVFNVSDTFHEDISIVVLVSFSSFCIKFILSLFSSILEADQRPAINKIFGTLSNIILLICVFLLIKYTDGSIVLLSYAYAFSVILSLGIGTFYFFSTDYKIYRPSVKYINLSYGKELTSLGLKFFLLQLSMILIYATDRFLINHVDSPERVISYDGAVRFFNIIQLPLMTIVAPFWAPITDAYTKNEFGWIKNSIKKLLRIWVFAVFGGLLMLVLSGSFFELWLGNKVDIPFSLSVLVLSATLLNIITTIYGIFFNGIGVLKLVLIISVILGLINIPLSIYFGSELGYGALGVIFATIICTLIRLLFNFIQYQLIINGKAKGIWIA